MSKEESDVPIRIRKRWACYVAAAAGVACLSPEAKADIVYQPQQYVITPNSSTNLPIGQFWSEHSFQCLAATGPDCLGWWRANDVGAGARFTEANDSAGQPILTGLGKGQLVGGSLKFGAGFFFLSRSSPYGTNTHLGWAGGSFIGFELPLGGGQYNFGWAQVSLQTYRQTPYSSRNYGWAIHINGYAYETTPNVPISAGQTTETDPPVPEPGSLGLLALGCLGLHLRRRKHVSSS